MRVLGEKRTVPVDGQRAPDDDLVDRVQAAAVFGDEDELVPVAVHSLCAEADGRAGVAGFDGCLGAQAQGAASRKLVGIAAAEGVRADATAQHPHRMRARFLLRQVGEVGEGGESEDPEPTTVVRLPA